MDLAEKAQRAQRILRTAADMSKQYYEKPLVVCYSTGKDSDTMLDLAEKALKPDEFEVTYSLTSVDAPESIYHMREVFKRLNSKGIKATVHVPRYKDGTQATMWNLIPKKTMPPTRLVRYCCQVLKEQSTPNRYIATGVRRDESSQRSTRSEFEVRGKTKADGKGFTLEHTEEVYQEAQEWDEVYDCTLITAAKQHKDLICNPIFDFTEQDVWQYIHENHIKYNPLYDKGYRRVGCVGCPLGGPKHQLKEFADYPIYKSNYIKAFDRMVQERKRKGLPCDWDNGEQVYNWWLGIDGNQLSLTDVFNEDGSLRREIEK